MFKKILKIFLYILIFIVTLLGLILAYSNLPAKKVERKADLGVTFSHRYASDIGLDWKEVYLAALDDLKIKRMRIPVYWDLVEAKEGQYDFSDAEWQLKEAEKRKVEIILAVGQKVPRWPECFIPDWIGEDEGKRKDSLIKFVEAAVKHFKYYPAIKYWQVENEPFLDFGVCPNPDYNLVDREIAAVRKIDDSRKIIITDGGEMSFWISAAKRSDIFGTTLYREVVNKRLGEWEYPIGPNFFKLKKFLLKIFTGEKKVIVIELQGEPWLNEWTVNAPLEKQLDSMNSHKLKDNVQFAKDSGFSEIYLWGVEWWYYLKTQKDYPAVWEEAKRIFSENN